MSWGQCYNPTYYYRDVDGDGFGKSIEFDDYDHTTVKYDWIESGSRASYSAIDGSIAYSCVRPQGFSWNNFDLDDSDPCIGKIPPQNFYRDTDGDSFGNPQNFVFCSIRPSGYVKDRTDCNDNVAAIHPNLVWYSDQDGDGFGGNYTSRQSCTRPPSYVPFAGDACDTDSSFLILHFRLSLGRWNLKK